MTKPEFLAHLQSLKAATRFITFAAYRDALVPEERDTGGLLCQALGVRHRGRLVHLPNVATLAEALRRAGEEALSTTEIEPFAQLIIQAGDAGWHEVAWEMLMTWLTQYGAEEIAIA